MNEFTENLRMQTNSLGTIPIAKSVPKTEVVKEIDTVTLRELTSRRLKLPMILNKMKTMNYNDKPDPKDIEYIMRVLLQKIIMSEFESNKYRIKSEFRNSGTHKNSLSDTKNTLNGEQVPDILRDHQVIAEYFIKGSTPSEDEYVGNISIAGNDLFQMLNNLDKITRYQEFQKKSILDKKTNPSDKSEEKTKDIKPPPDIDYTSINLRSTGLESSFTNSLRRKQQISKNEQDLYR